jgi:2-amino-4-hydroxy-6-hydroxymethyldihydropteridine diphosphokinase
VAIALGSNLGDRQRHLREAASRLSSSVSGLRLSGFHDTEPVGVPAQPRFLNAAAAGACSLAPRDLLEELLAIERAFGRERPFAGAPRTLDLDLILYGDAIVNEPGLVIPHPRFRERRFVLAPLAEIAPDWVDPVTKLTIATLLDRLARHS